jgi:hypothetical protein
MLKYFRNEINQPLDAVRLPWENIAVYANLVKKTD